MSPREGLQKVVREIDSDLIEEVSINEGALTRIELLLMQILRELKKPGQMP
jgi:hypothetical protein